MSRRFVSRGNVPTYVLQQCDFATAQVLQIEIHLVFLGTLAFLASCERSATSTSNKVGEDGDGNTAVVVYDMLENAQNSPGIESHVDVS